MLMGKGMLIWQAWRVAERDTQRLVRMATEAGLQWVAIKVADGTAIYPSAGRWMSAEAAREEQRFMRGAVSALLEAGVEVYGWGWTYGANWIRRSIASREADVAADAVEMYGVRGFLVDAEHYYKRPGAATWARAYMTGLRRRLGEMPIGLCSYRYPSLHPEFPWQAFLMDCDFHVPQVYWMKAQNAGAQLRRSIRELRGLRDLPIVPIGAAFREHGWEPTVRSMQDFVDTAHELGLPGLGWWVWDQAERRPEWWEVIAGDAWDVGAPAPEEQPEEALSLEARVARLEQAAREHGWQV